MRTLFCFLLLLFSFTHSQDFFFDSANGNDANFPNCPQSNPCRNLNLVGTTGFGIDTVFLQPGTSINLLPGVYNLNTTIELNGNNIAIRGLGSSPSDVLIRAIGTTPNNAHFFGVSCTSCIWENFVIDQSLSFNVATFYFDNCNDCIVRNLEFFQNFFQLECIEMIRNINFLFQNVIFRDNDLTSPVGFPPDQTRIIGINSGDQISFDGCQFMNNTAPRIIHWINDALPTNLTNCVFDSNVATESSILDLGGGPFSIFDSLFQNNLAPNGAVFLPTTNEDSLVIMGSTFINNASPNQGGAINVASTSAPVTIDNSTFLSNTIIGIEGGGAILNLGTLTVTNSVFQDHRIQPLRFSGFEFPSVAGAIFNGIGGSLTIDNTIFSGSNIGGGLGASILFDSSTGTVTNCQFLNNVGNGAVALRGTSTVSFGSGVIFSNNTRDIQATDGSTANFNALIDIETLSAAGNARFQFTTDNTVSSMTMIDSSRINNQAVLNVMDSFSWRSSGLIDGCGAACPLNLFGDSLLVPNFWSLRTQLVNYGTFSLETNMPQPINCYSASGAASFVNEVGGTMTIGGCQTTGANTITNRGSFTANSVTFRSGTTVTLEPTGTMFFTVQDQDTALASSFLSGSTLNLAGSFEVDRVPPYWPNPSDVYEVLIVNTATISGAFIPNSAQRLSASLDTMSGNFILTIDNVFLIAGDDSVRTPEDTPLTFNPFLNDFGQGGILSIVGTSDDMSLNATEDQALLFTPQPNFFGQLSLSYTIMDVNGVQQAATINVTVDPINDPPEIQEESIEFEPQTYNFTFPVTDVDSSVLTYTLFTLPEDGTLSTLDGTILTEEDLPFIFSDGILTYTANSGSSDADEEIEYRVADEDFELESTLTLQYRPDVTDLTPVITGVVIAGIVCCFCILFIAVVGLFFYKKNQKVVSVLDLSGLGHFGSGSVIISDSTEEYAELVQKARLQTLIDSEDIVIQDKLGEGAFGVVLKAMYQKKTVAVKQIKSASIDQTGLLEFLEEAKVVATIPEHPNVVKVLGVCPSPFSILFEFCEGGSLESYLANTNHNITMRDVLSWAVQIAQGIDHIHQSNIIHRDLATRNVLLTDYYKQAKISDFGMSRLSSTGKSNYTVSNVGPLKWMAPEALLNRKYSVKTDMWAFGVCLVEMITRRLPFPEIDAQEFALRYLSEKLTVLSYIPVKTTPDFLRDVIKSTQRANPEERPSFSTVIENLRRHLTTVEATIVDQSELGIISSIENSQALDSSPHSSKGSMAPPTAQYDQHPGPISHYDHYPMGSVTSGGSSEYGAMGNPLNLPPPKARGSVNPPSDEQSVSSSNAYGAMGNPLNLPPPKARGSVNPPSDEQSVSSSGAYGAMGNPLNLPPPKARGSVNPPSDDRSVSSSGAYGAMGNPLKLPPPRVPPRN